MSSPSQGNSRDISNAFALGKELCEITSRPLHSRRQHIRTRLRRPEPTHKSSGHTNDGLHQGRQDGRLHGGAPAQDPPRRKPLRAQDSRHLRRQAVRPQPEHVHGERLSRDPAGADWRPEPHGGRQLGPGAVRDQRDRPRDEGAHRDTRDAEEAAHGHRRMHRVGESNHLVHSGRLPASGRQGVRAHLREGGASVPARQSQRGVSGCQGGLHPHENHQPGAGTAVSQEDGSSSRYVGLKSLA